MIKNKHSRLLRYNYSHVSRELEGFLELYNAKSGIGRVSSSHFGEFNAQFTFGTRRRIIKIDIRNLIGSSLVIITWHTSSRDRGLSDKAIDNLSERVDIHCEKVARREVGSLTARKPISKSAPVQDPPNRERPVKYIRKHINYSDLDDLGMTS